MLKAALLVYEQNNHIQVVQVCLNEEEKIVFSGPTCSHSLHMLAR